ncbi:MAG: hypothetical protein ACXWHC_16945 [Usitatibacter sp.]
MTSVSRRFLATLLATFGFAFPASATTYSTDYTDLWWNSNENGWGVNVIQQYETLFATLFVYGADNSARWYVASDLKPSGSGVFTGTLYQTTGPAFSAVWNAPAVATSVGTMTFTFSSAVTGTLTYSINNTTVTKAITRNTFRPNNLTGGYAGGMVGIASSCSASVDNGNASIFGNLSITQNGDTVAMRVDFTNFFGQIETCNFTGTHQQLGRIGTISGGSMVCTVGTNTVSSGTFTMTQIDGSINGLSSVFTGSDQFCTYNGRFGGLRVN